MSIDTTAAPAASQTTPIIEAPEPDIIVRATCQNCESTLMGPFCHFCGQPVRGPIREFLSFISDGTNEIIRPDSKLARTLMLLFFRPGLLTARYLDGKRVQFVKPIKLYLSLSLLLFLVLSIDTTMADLTGEHRPPIIELDDTPTPDPTAEKKARTKQDVGINNDGVHFSYKGKPWHADNNPLQFARMPNWINRWANEKLRHIDQAAKTLESDPSRIADRVLSMMPTAMFLMLPLFALILKFFYLFKSRLYAEHLLVAVQSHSFMFLGFTAICLSNIAARIWPVIEPATGFLTILIVIWIPIYLFWMQKTVYQQGWIMSMFKFCCVGFVYMLLISFILAGAFIGALANY